MAKLSDRLASALLARGMTEESEVRTSKYRVFRTGRYSHINGKEIKYYVGKSGALRFGTSVSDSQSSGENIRKKLLDGTA